MAQANELDLNLKEILEKAGKPVGLQEACEFAYGIPPGPKGTYYPGHADLVTQFWLEVGRNRMTLTLDRKMALKV